MRNRIKRMLTKYGMFMNGKKVCICGSSDVRIVACSGASNVGQIANQAAIGKDIMKFLAEYDSNEKLVLRV